MKKQNIDKLALLLMGLRQRSQDNRDFFIGMNIMFKSGRKEFPATAVQKGDVFQLSYKGRKDSLDFEGICRLILREAADYDALGIEYVERGTIILIEGDSKAVNIRYADNIEDEDAVAKKQAQSMLGNREYRVKVGPASKLLKEIGILTQEGKIKNDKIRKYNQIDHFVELVDDIIKSFEHKETINIIDCACGKSYLSFVLNFYIKDVLKKNCHFIGIDNSESVIEASRKMAENLGYKNMEFVTEDLVSYSADRTVDMVISLHACDIATDMAIALGVRAGAGAIIAVPCCHKELLEQYSFEAFAPILKHGVFKARMADLITDGLRALLLEGHGYEVSAIEYISPLDTPKNLMIRAVKKEDTNHQAMESYTALKEMLRVEPTLEKLIY
ncbi:methyltransferase [Peptoclostridium acidaminophilum DSM 3953]|uniref:Methyltransferase n=1 Tax=Peptoclostridium acidaminophilum DSM 3953 TaxID=1286171 RepID=W8T2Q7_PEPAC|nr:SAM-dependent methyltransferase [Peptoclostridium acidaminophilum]AHM56029.1 methyltransferase [Peptoclostridium acidaminophilum DSM 3953]